MIALQWVEGEGELYFICLNRKNKTCAASLELSFCKLEHASLLNHHAATQGKADATAAALGGEEGNEERLAVLGWDGQTVVADVEGK